MENLTSSIKDAAFATNPREFDLSYSTTLEEIMEKLNARRAAFQMPFQIKGGIPGQRISFEKGTESGRWPLAFPQRWHAYPYAACDHGGQDVCRRHAR